MKKQLTKTLALTALVGGSYVLDAQTASIQVIHNSPDAAAGTVDVWAGPTKLIDNLSFRNASQTFTNIPAGVNIVIGVAPATSTASSQSIANFTVSFAANSRNIIVADGIVSGTGYNPGNTTAGFTLNTYTAGLVAAPNGTTTSVLVHHGSTDAPTVDVVAPFSGTNPFLPNALVDNASYGAFAGYLNLPTANYKLQVRDQNSENVVAEYSAPLQTLNLGGSALTVVASGFLNPANNSNGAAFGLYVALPAGGALIPLPMSTISSTRVQAIHNSADAAAAQVDLYIQSASTGTAAIKAADNFAFRTATPFIDVPTGEVVTISVAAPTSTSAANPIKTFTYNLAATSKYQLIASGLVSGSGYSPAATVVPFDLKVSAVAKEKSSSLTITDVLVFHGSTDAPTVDVVAPFSGANPFLPNALVDNASYGAFAGYLNLPTANYKLQVRDQNSENVVAEYSAPLQTLNLGGSALTVVASGFLNPANNSNGAAFGLYVALPAGGALIPLPTSTISSTRVQAIHNSADAAAAQVDLYIQSASTGTAAIKAADNFAFRTATPFIDVPTGEVVTISVAAPTSTSAANPIKTFTYNLAATSKYQLIASGLVSGSGYSPAATAVPFDLKVSAVAKEKSSSLTITDVLVFHGSTDAPTVDVVAPFSGANPFLPNALVDNASYGAFAGYLNLPTANYKLQVRDQNSENVVAEYSAPLQTLNLGGSALTVVASGFLNPANNSNGAAFGLYVALPAGGALIPLPTSTISSTRVQAIHNSADAAAAQVDLYIQSASTGTAAIKAADNFAFRTATPFIDVPTGEVVTISVAAPTSTSAVNPIKTFTYNLAATSKYQLIASGLVSPSGYTPNSTVAPFNLIANANVRERALVASNTDVLIFHGVTDAPAVGVTAWPTPTLATGLTYANYNSIGYNALPTNNYSISVTAGSSTVASYGAPLATLSLTGQAITVLASGFLTPANNSNGAAFGLWVALASGGNLIPLPAIIATSIGEDSKLDQFLNIYPNPFNNNLNIKNNSNSNLTISIIDVSGRVIVEHISDLELIDLNTSELVSGVYFLNISNGESQSNYKIIK